MKHRRMPFPNKRYELFGWDYEKICPLSQKEIDWYTYFAEETGGPILELACGTGRLLIEIAKLGYDCEGIDLSSAMLNRAKDRISQLPSEIASRINVSKMDMTDLSFDRKFALAIIADNSFRELATTNQQMSCLRSIEQHLKQDGILLVTVRRFRPEQYRDGFQEFGWSTPLRNPNSDEIVTRRGEFRYIEKKKRISGAFFYKVTRADGSSITEKCSIEVPVMVTRDYIDIFSEVGFQSDVFIG